MNNNIDEQKSELEALSEIYYNEIQVKSNAPPISFSIHIRPQASSYEEPELVGEEDAASDSDDDGGDETVCEKTTSPSVELLFELPEDYPNVKPLIQALDHTNLEEQDVEELLANIDRKAEECLGSVMVFVIVSDVVEWLSSVAEREVVELEREKSRRLEELEAEERRKADGTPVGLETFLAWKAKFDAELLRSKIEQQKKQIELNPAGQKRLTGREMFERDTALAESDLNFVDELEQGELEALMQNIDEIELEDDDDDDGDFELVSGDEVSGEEPYDSDD